MFFVSKKKYNAMVAERDKWDGIASEAVAQNGRLLDEWHATIKNMKNIQEFNHHLIEHNNELLARVKELEAELQATREYSQQWANDFEELDIAYGQLETDYDRLREELSHYEYEERFRNPKEEVEEED